MTFNLHPLLVHFPIAGGILLAALTFIFLFFKKEGAQKAALWVLPFTAIGAALAATTGLLFEEFFPHPHEGPAHQLMELHETFGLITAGTFAALTILAWILRRKDSTSLRALYFFGIFAVMGLVGWTGYLGGELGHTHGLALPESKKAEISPGVPETQETKPRTGPEEKPAHEHGHDHKHN